VLASEGVVRNDVLVNPLTFIADYPLSYSYRSENLSRAEILHNETEIMQQRLQIWQADPLLKDMYAFSNT